MNQVSRHISYLLLTCRKVSIQGLGTFSACYESAFFDPDDGIFYPSRIKINYEPQKEDNSYILLSSLKRKLKIKETEAEGLIDKFVDDIRKKIEKNHYCRLEGIGYLIDQKGSLTLKDTFWKKTKFSSLSNLQYSPAQIS